MKSFATKVETGKPSKTVIAEVLATITTPLADAGYKLAGQGDANLVYNRTYRPWFVWVAVIIFFPIGLLALLYTETANITVSTTESDGRTTVHVSGRGGSEVRGAFERMQF